MQTDHPGTIVVCFTICYRGWGIMYKWTIKNSWNLFESRGIISLKETIWKKVQVDHPLVQQARSRRRSSARCSQHSLEKVIIASSFMKYTFSWLLIYFYFQSHNLISFSTHYDFHIETQHCLEKVMFASLPMSCALSWLLVFFLHFLNFQIDIFFPQLWSP